MSPAEAFNEEFNKGYNATASILSKVPDYVKDPASVISNQLGAIANTIAP